jgi:hypothetical protein
VSIRGFPRHPIGHTIYQNIHERNVQLTVPLTLAQIKHIEDVRNGIDLRLRLTLSGLVALKQLNEFERLQI